MAVLRFTTSRLSELQPAGRLDELQHATIAPFLERELGPTYGRLFADFETEGADVRDWYTDTLKPPRAIASLSGPEQEALRQEVAEMIAKITDLANRIAGEGTQKAKLARILLTATTFPAEDLWRADKQPVIVNWGFHRRGEKITTGTIITAPTERPKPAPPQGAVAESQRTDPPPPPIVPPARQAWRFRPWVVFPALLWLLFVILVAGSYRLLLPACGVRWPILASLSLLDACDVTATSEGLAAEGAALQREVDEAELNLRRQKVLCVPEQRAPAPPPPERRAEAPPAPRPAPTPPAPKPVPAPVKKIEDALKKALPPDAPHGKVEVSLVWNNVADLDLIIDCPDGDTLWRKKLQACGGEILKDIIPSSTDANAAHAEHAAWATSPRGRFKIKVELYSYSSVPDGTDIPFQILIKRGEEVEIVDGHIKGAHTTVTATTAEL